MEASTTTLNIQPEVPVENHGHTHKFPNFGRFIKGCAACEAKGRPAPKAKAAKAPKQEKAEAPVTAAAPQGTQLEQLLGLLVQREAKTVQKEADAEARREQARQDMVRMAAEQIELEKQRWAACGAAGHRKENGRSAISGQVHNDGLYHPFCQRCFQMLTPRAPRNEELSNGIQIAS